MITFILLALLRLLVTLEKTCPVISQGINAGDVKKLQDAGIYTCNGLMMHTKKVLESSAQVIKCHDDLA